MNKTKKKNNFFPIIIALLILFFSIIIFLSIPVLFNYKSIESEIEKKFYSKFNINLKILDEIKYQFIPLPHLLIKKANLNLNFENTKSSIFETENLKIFLSPKSLYPKSNLQFHKTEIQNTNFKFKFEDVKSFREHLYDKKNNPIIVKKSKLFFLDRDNNVIFISPIDKLSYKINKNDNYKKLKIKGNIFDIDYDSLWKRNYEIPNKSQTEIKLRNPNLLLKNLLEIEDNLKFKGESSINFLNDTITIKYFLANEKIKIVSPNSNEKIKIFSNIELNPFYLDTKITFIKHKLNFLVDELLHSIINFNPEMLGNLNGNISVNFDSIENELINRGTINILVNEKTIHLKKTFFEIDGAQIKSKISYFEDKGDLIFVSKNSLKIKNKKKFSKKFQVKLEKIKNIDNINFNLIKNIDTGKISISEIKINNLKNEKVFKETYNVRNIQEIKSLLKVIFNA